MDQDLSMYAGEYAEVLKADEVVEEVLGRWVPVADVSKTGSAARFVYSCQTAALSKFMVIHSPTH